MSRSGSDQVPKANENTRSTSKPGSAPEISREQRASQHSVRPVEWGRSGSLVDPSEAKPDVDLVSKYGIKPVGWGRPSQPTLDHVSTADAGMNAGANSGSVNSGSVNSGGVNSGGVNSGGVNSGVPAGVDSNVPATPRWKRILYWCCGVVLALLVLAVLAVWLVIEHHEAGLPNAKQLRHSYRPQQVTRVLARDGTVLSEIFTERRTVVPFESIPSHTKLAFLAAEDARFYEHEGLNYLGMLRALLVNLRAGRTVQGGSTITQQVVKNVHLDSKRTYARKIQETILARRLEQSLSKDEILSLYLNHIYLGHGRYGIEEAARVYFGKHASELDLAESATLAGIVASPERYSPRRDAQKALDRRRFVLGQMREKRFISLELEQQAAAETLRLAPLSEDESDLAPEMVAIAKQTLERVAPDQASRGGFTVSSTIDPALQAAARRAIRENLQDYAKKYRLDPPYNEKSGRLWGPLTTTTPRRYHAAVGEVIAANDSDGTLDVRAGGVVGQVRLAHETWLNSKNLPPSKFATIGARIRVVIEGELSEPKPLMRLDPVPQSALVAIDVRTRQVLALVGSREALAGGLDRATQARRQPGSSFKPFVYSQALSSHRYTPATMIALPPAPSRPDGLKLLLRDALARSENDVAVQLLDAVGAPRVIEFAKACGIESKLAPTPSLALGAYEVTPLEITNAYATFASGGVSAAPIFITRVARSDGKELPIGAPGEAKQVMSPDDAYLITSMMRSVVERGTAQRAKRLGRPVVGKTGTTNQAKDTWFVGYSPEIVAGVWVGFDDAVSLGHNETGGNTALPAWVEFMKAALAGRPTTDFARPAGIVVERIDPKTGLLAFADQSDAIDEEFLPGTAPTETAAPDAGVPPPSAPVETQPQAPAAAPGDNAGAQEPPAKPAVEAREPEEPAKPEPAE